VPIGRNAVAAIFAVAAGLSTSPAAAQSGPSVAERQAAGRELSLPTGVGGCVMRAMDPGVRQSVLAAFESGTRSTPPVLPSAVAQVSERCTGRAYSKSDAALVAATLGALQRTGIAVYFAAELAIGQRRLDAVWAEAPADEKAPFLQAARDMLDPKAPPSAPSPAQTIPFARRLQIDPANTRMLSPVQLYYLATAFGEAGETKLAAQGVKPAAP
jgi:hypothetical protein